MSPTDMLNEDGAGEYLGGVPPATLKQWRYRGIGPRYAKFGRHVRYRRSDLDAYLDAHTVDPTATSTPSEDRYARLRRGA